MRVAVVRWSLLVLLVGSGCDERAPLEAATADEVFEVRPEQAGNRCVTGGVAILRGDDRDGDGHLGSIRDHLRTRRLQLEEEAGRLLSSPSEPRAARN
jgi:hypothetical protein